MFRLKFLTAALVAAVAALGTPMVSQAAFTVTIWDGVNAAVVISDGGAGDANGQANRINYANTYFGYDIDIRARTNSPGGETLLGPNGAELFQNSITVKDSGTGPASGPLTITIFSDGYQPFGASVSNSTVVNTLAASAVSPGTTVSLSTAVNPGSGTVTTLGAQLTAAGEATTYAYPSSLGNPFSVTQVATVTLGPSSGAGATFTGTSTVVAPAPAGLVMAVTALPFFGLIRRRLRKDAAPTA